MIHFYNRPRSRRSAVDGARVAMFPSPTVTANVVRQWPHDVTAFTQGLALCDGSLIESTGRYGESTLRRVRIETGEVLARRDLPSDVFGEGVAVCGGRILQLSWREHVVFVYDRHSFELVDTLWNPGEGWGLATDGSTLAMTDGTSLVRFVRPDDFTVLHAIQVSEHGRSVDALNDIAFAHGELVANVWHSDQLVRIDAMTGEVRGRIDLTALRTRLTGVSAADALNGIAFNASSNRLLVTGKLWPSLFEIEWGRIRDVERPTHG